MKTIIAATDFSPAATNAVNYAADMAIALNAELLLLYTFQVPMTYAEVPVAVNLDDLQKNAEHEIAGFTNKLSEKYKSKLSIKAEVRMGTFFQELSATCERVKPYAVIMGSQGTTAAERLLFGSHAVHAMKDLEWPVITVPPGRTFSSIKNIAFASDFGEAVSTMPVNEIKSLTQDFKAKLHVINTGKKDQYNPDVVFGSGLLKDLLSPVQPQYHFLSGENTDDAIISFAEENNIDLLIVMPKRYTLIDKLLHRSHTKQMVLHSHVPVMAMHSHT